MKFLLEVTHRGVTACHYLENKKYMIWYYKAGEPMKTVGIIQVRGISEPLTEKELKIHIDNLWDRYYVSQKRRDKSGVAGNT